MPPPWAFTISWEILRPRPKPARRIFCAFSAWKNRSNTRGRSSFEMPMPVSRTLILMILGPASTLMNTEPFSEVYWIAFVERFWITCPRRSGSPWMIGNCGGSSMCSLISRLSAATFTRENTSLATCSRSQSSRLTRSLPFSIAARSTRSEISPSSVFEEDWICVTHLSRSGCLIFHDKSSA